MNHKQTQFVQNMLNARVRAAAAAANGIALNVNATGSHKTDCSRIPNHREQWIKYWHRGTQT